MANRPTSLALRFKYCGSLMAGRTVPKYIRSPFSLPPRGSPLSDRIYGYTPSGRTTLGVGSWAPVTTLPTVGYYCGVQRPGKVRALAALVLLAACSSEAVPTPVVPPRSTPPPPIEGAAGWVAFELMTHCGIDRSAIEFDGHHWEAIGPGPLNDGSGNPPPGFGNPTDSGWIARIGANDAAYQSSAGVPLFLRRLDEPRELGPCF